MMISVIYSLLPLWLVLLVCHGLQLESDHAQAILLPANPEYTSHQYVPPWQTSPKPGSLPKALTEEIARINKIDLWYAIYGTPLEESIAKGLSPVVFLHGGFANSDYYANQIKYLKDSPYTLIAIDSRAQGRSSDDLEKPITYDLMTQDVIALMDHLHIDRFSTVGWSDGSCISFNLAMNYTTRIDRIFAFGGTYSYKNINETVMDTPTFSKYMEWVRDDYKRLSPSHGSFDSFEERMLAMWSTEPVWSAESFQKVTTLYSDPKNAPIIWIVAGDSEEAVTRSTPHELHSWIWGSSLVMLPSVSHFAMLQDPQTFNIMLERLLQIERQS